MFNFKLHSFSLGNFILQHQNINFKYLTWRRKGTLFYNALFYLLLSGKSFTRQKNKAETLLQDFSLFCYFACCKKTVVT